MVRNDEIIEVLASILSCGNYYKFSDEVIMKRIAYHPFFIMVEKEKESSVLYQNIDTTVNEIFYDIDLSQYDYRIYNQSLWLAELYVNIHKQTKMTFEAIFLYLPLAKGYSMFPLYHEMDFSQGVDYFISLTEKQGLIALLMKKKGISVVELAKKSGLSYVMTSKLKRREKDISKVAASNYLNLVSCLDVRPETLIRA